MASDSITERREEWQAQLDEVLPQIRGLEDKVNDALSEELRAVLNERLAFLKQRESLINSSIAAQDAAEAAEAILESHGFPSLPDMEISAILLEELDREVADNLAARSGFGVIPLAANMSVSLGSPTDKP
jgi:cobalamin-dependent methionine synthase I